MDHQERCKFGSEYLLPAPSRGSGISGTHVWARSQDLDVEAKIEKMVFVIDAVGGLGYIFVKLEHPE